LGAHEPATVIRQYLDGHGGETKAAVSHLLATFGVEESDDSGREEIASALDAAGIKLDRSIRGLGPDETVHLRAVPLEGGAPGEEPALGNPPAGWYDDPEVSGGHRYWSGSEWSEQRRPPAVAPEVSTRETAPAPALERSRVEERAPRGFSGWIASRPLAVFWVTLILALLVGIGLGAASSEDQPKKDQSRAKLANARAEIRRERSAARGDIRSEQRAAAATLEGLRRKTDSQRGKLRDEKGKVAAERQRLDRLTNEVSGARTAAAKNTIPGNGTFQVGADINPGTYRAEAEPGCYWARLSSLDTSDIIDNDNADGPVVIEILPSDKAFQAKDCADFHKSG
jgi:hypothetical protein